MGMPLKIHFLDVGSQKYGDAVLCDFGDTTVLIDGAHRGDQRGNNGYPSIPDQLQNLLGTEPPFHLNLIVVSHTHDDHIGCLPTLVASGQLQADWVLAADPDLGWGGLDLNEFVALAEPDPAHLLALAFREEPPPIPASQREAQEFLNALASLQPSYKEMLNRLAEDGAEVVRHGLDDLGPIQEAFKAIGLRIIGPTNEQLNRCSEYIGARIRSVLESETVSNLALDPISILRAAAGGEIEGMEASARSGAAVNLQSTVTAFTTKDGSALFAGDMQFADPGVASSEIIDGVAELRGDIRRVAPFDVVKISHHGSNNAFSEAVLHDLRDSSLFGICAGVNSDDHPDDAVLETLDHHAGEVTWVRTDRNGLSTVELNGGSAVVHVARGQTNDATLPNEG